MIITVSVISGFKHSISDKVVGFGSHIQITNFMAQQTAIPAPICISDTLMRDIKKTKGIRHVACYSMTQGILKTDDDFLQPGRCSPLPGLTVFIMDAQQPEASASS